MAEKTEFLTTVKRMNEEWMNLYPELNESNFNPDNVLINWDNYSGVGCYDDAIFNRDIRPLLFIEDLFNILKSCLVSKSLSNNRKKTFITKEVLKEEGSFVHQYLKTEIKWTKNTNYGRCVLTLSVELCDRNPYKGMRIIVRHKQSVLGNTLMVFNYL
ncbi:MAG: hypothetical protein R3Y43_00370 [Alphaproteobacteria bacterium]